jgi:hypothetical protein
MDNHIKIGCHMHTKSVWRKLKKTDIEKMDTHAWEFWKENKKWILSL